MRNSWRYGIGLIGAWGGSAMWAVGLTLLQPLTEPGKPWQDATAQNNTYWARDVRWSAMILVTLSLILIFNGHRKLSWYALGGGIVWAGTDVALDRLDVAGQAALGWI